MTSSSFFFYWSAKTRWREQWKFATTFDRDLQ